MKLPNWTQLIKEHYKQTEEGLIRLLNDKLSLIHRALDKSLTYEDNLDCEKKTLNFTFTPTSFPISLSTKYKTIPDFVEIKSIRDITTSTYSTEAAIKWTYSNQQIIINEIITPTPLEESKRYEIKLLIVKN